MDRDDSPSATTDRPGRGRLVALVAALVAVAIAVAAVLVLRGGDDGPGSEPSAPASSPTAPGAAGTDDDTAEPESTDADLPASGPEAEEAPPVALDASPTVAPGVTLRVKDVTSADGTAMLPGEVSGPAVRVELELTNGSGSPVDLSTTVVGLAYGSGRIPANTFSTGTSSFTGSVQAGSSATGTYVFAVPADERSSLRITVDTAVDVPVVVFEGAAS